MVAPSVDQIGIRLDKEIADIAKRLDELNQTHNILSERLTRLNEARHLYTTVSGLEELQLFLTAMDDLNLRY